VNIDNINFKPFEKKIFISRGRESLEVGFLESESHGLVHGILLRFDYNGKIDVIGIGRGYASHLNMFQSYGTWHWKTISLDPILTMYNSMELECDDFVYLISKIIRYIDEPIVERFIMRFIEIYPMHGKKLCTRIEKI